MTQRKWLRPETAGGLLLLAAAALALILDNSRFASWYDALLQVPMQVRVGSLDISKPLLLWINDGLMAIFFLLVGLEIKREVFVGQLRSREQAMLPAMAAIGGMAIPALIFWWLNAGTETARGWAIPAATDIAFALGLLALLGSRVPVQVKIFLTAVAIIDDLGAIAVIALFYTEELSWLSLGAGGAFTLGLVLLNRFRVQSITPYALIGLGLWVCVLKSGVHATLAGVVVALAIPLKVGAANPLKQLEHALHPWVMFLVMPIFAFANAGVALAGLSFASLLQPLPLGIMLGLFLGKQIGVMGFAWIAIKLRWAKKPPGVSWQHLYGAALLSGVGFTMSLFIGTLAFDSAEHATGVRLGVLSGSLLSGLAGLAVLAYARPTVRPTESEEQEAVEEARELFGSGVARTAAATNRPVAPTVVAGNT